MFEQSLKGYEINSKILTNHESYVIRVLQPSHAKEAVELLSNVFIDYQPLAIAFYQAFPAERNEKLEIYRKYWDCFIDEYTANKLSVGCFNTQKNDELVGVSVAKDFFYTSQRLDDLYMNRLTPLSSVLGFEQHMISLMDEEFKNQLSQKGTVIDIMAVAIKPEHSGKRILGKMMEKNLLLGRKAGYAHAICFASNFRTSLTLKRLDFVLIKEGDASSFEVYGVRPFKEVDKQQQYSQIWMKELSLPSKTQD